MSHYANRILILFAHPALQKSRVNQRLIERAHDLEGVTVHDLYEVYPDFHIRVKREQSLLLDHELIVFHHPFYWYSAPALIKEWQDLVLEHGWAYGKGGTALAGKKMLSVITAGGSEQSYQKGGHNQFTMGEFLAPFKQSANLCGMRYLSPFVVYATHQLSDRDIAQHAEDYQRVIVALRDGTIDLDAAVKLPRLNAQLDKLIKS